MTEGQRQQLQSLQQFFLAYAAPDKFDPYEAENILMKSETSFEDIVATMEDNGIHRPKELTEFEFYNRVKYLKNKYKEAAHASQ